jgi:hypothetical protein
LPTQSIARSGILAGAPLPFHIATLCSGLIQDVVSRLDQPCTFKLAQKIAGTDDPDPVIDNGAAAQLTRAQSIALVSRLAGGKALPGDLLEQIIQKTDGVPLFVEELTKSILESGALIDAGDRRDYVAPAGPLSIPPTLRDSLMARLDRFAPVREVAQIGAAIGREFSYALIAAVAPRLPRPSYWRTTTPRRDSQRRRSRFGKRSAAWRSREWPFSRRLRN